MVEYQISKIDAAVDQLDWAIRLLLDFTTGQFFYALMKGAFQTGVCPAQIACDPGNLGHEGQDVHRL